ncbi:MAG: 4-hydroxy-tetrahydrodipicolinate synthase [Apilactobacillus kunkeei]|nr:4-hydroxy-tetrahydrodipicolinate synthase [Apilactobacillus kunkeei]
MTQNIDIMTAIITPFDDNGNIDYAALERVTQHCLENGSRGFVIGGTTGETPTLTTEEKIELYTRFGAMVGDSAYVIAGTGSNNTEATIEFNRQVQTIAGIDALLVVVPYYNKPDQRSMIAHFTSVADQATLPIYIYNIPGRTGVTMANDTVVELSHHQNIIGVKQCTSMEDLEYLVDHTEDGFHVYSGEDAQSLFAKAIGADGIISVASHIYGAQMREMYEALENGDYRHAGELQRWLTPRMNALFMYPSPSPVKAVLNAQGFAVGGCRLPILPLDDEERRNLARHLELPEDALLHDLGLEMRN